MAPYIPDIFYVTNFRLLTPALEVLAIDKESVKSTLDAMEGVNVVHGAGNIFYILLKVVFLVQLKTFRKTTRIKIFKKLLQGI